MLQYTERFAHKIQRQLGEEWDVRWAMRYGQPKLRELWTQALRDGADEIYFVPLYPQYAKSSTETSLREAFRVISQEKPKTEIRFLRDFFRHPEFIKSFAGNIRAVQEDKGADFFLFSFHGLPEHHITELDTVDHGCLMREDCCMDVTENNRHCYRAQCYATAHAIAKELNLKHGYYQVSFQSRLGNRPWIQPYTDKVIPELVEQGVERLAVVCPSFVADCLETLEEIGIGAREQFQELGGKELFLVPSLNDGDQWVSGFANMMKSSNINWERLN